MRSIFRQNMTPTMQQRLFVSNIWTEIQSTLWILPRFLGDLGGLVSVFISFWGLSSSFVADQFFFKIVSKLYWSSISNNTHHHVHISFDIPNECFSIKWISFYYSKSESRPDGIPGISRRRELVTVSNIPNWTCMCVCVCLFHPFLALEICLCKFTNAKPYCLLSLFLYAIQPTNETKRINSFIKNKIWCTLINDEYRWNEWIFSFSVGHYSMKSFFILRLTTSSDKIFL